MTSMQSEFVIMSFNLAGPRCLNWFLWCLERVEGSSETYNWRSEGNVGPQHRLVAVVTSFLLNSASLLLSLPVSPVKNCRRGRGSGRPERWWAGMEIEHHRDTLTKYCPSQNIYTAIYMLYIHKYKWCIYTCICFRKIYLYIHIVKAMGFPVAMYACKSWAIKKAECLLNCGVREDSWESLGLQGDQSILQGDQSVNPKGNQPWIFNVGTDAGVKLQYFGHLRWRADSLEKTLLLGKIEGRRRRGQQKMR